MATTRAGFWLGTTLSLLVSCSGSGGSSNLMDPASTPTALQRLVGGTAPTETADEQDVRNRDISSRTDYRIDTGWYVDFRDASVQDYRTTVQCSGRACEHSGPGWSQSFDLESWSVRAIGTTILTRNGITIASHLSSGGSRYVSSTLNDSVFASNAQVRSDSLLRGSLAWGDLSGSEPSVSGVWRGMMSGVLAESDDLLLGDATLRYSASGSGGSLDAQFTNIVNFTRNRAHTLPSAEFANVQVGSDGTFDYGNPNNKIHGGFYGSTHSEATGIFEFGGILGAFGTKRQSP